MLSGLTQYSEYGADHCDAEDRVDQNSNSTLSVCVSIKQRKERRERLGRESDVPEPEPDLVLVNDPPPAEEPPVQEKTQE